MANTIKFEEVLKDINTTETIEWMGNNITIKHSLPLTDMMEFVTNVVDACFSDEDGTYVPEAKDFAVRLNVLNKYADLEMPEDIKDTYDICCRTDLYDQILRHINYVQFMAIEDAIDNNIEYRTNENVAAATRQMNEVYSAFESLEEKLSELFGAIDKDGVSKLISTLSENGLGFDEEKLVKAVISNKE